MVFSRDYVLAPHVVSVDFALAPALNVLESMALLTEVDDLSGLTNWVVETAARMPAERRWKTRLVFSAFDFVLFEYVDLIHADFEQFLNELTSKEPQQLVKSLWDQLAELPARYPEHWVQGKAVPTREPLMSDARIYADFMNTLNGDCEIEDRMWEEAYQLLQDPPRALALIVEHLQFLYDEYVKAEWTRVQPMLQESVAAFQKQDYSNLTAYEAIRAVTGRDLTGKLDNKVNRIEKLVFVPTAHIGPYVGKLLREDTLYVLFGARLPRGVQSSSSELSRAELLIRLNALSDDTRLRILELLTEHDELCAQDFVERLGLSQPTISRHLSQLSATGYIVERRRDVAKCYSLNSDRMADTLRALSSFLSRQ